MSFERLTTDTNVIRDLADRPNDVNGLSADQLKAKFDQIGEAIANYINNTLLASLEGDSAAGNIGIEEIDGLTAENVQEALLALKTAVDSAVTGDIPDDSLETVKYKDRSVTSAKIALAALLSEHYANRSITGQKVAEDTLETANYKTRSVTGQIIALGAITAELLANLSVTEPKLANGAVTPVKTTGIQAQHRTTTVTIPAMSAGGIAYVNNVPGVSATNTVLVSPDAASWIKWRDCGVRCTGQALNGLYFTAESATGEPLTANVIIFGV